MKIVGEFSMKGAATNTDVSFKFTDGSRSSGADIKASVGAVYKDADNATVTIDADVVDSLIHAASPSLSTGAIVSFGTSVSAAPFNLTFGGQYKLDSTSTVTGTADSKGKVSMAYKQKLNDFATIAVSGQVDAMALDSDNHKFGLKLNLGN